MNNSDQITKDEIIAATELLLKQEIDIEKITIRSIAEKANVGLGLINYHFRSKDNLIQTTLSKVMCEKASYYAYDQTIEDPLDRLKTMIKKITDYGNTYQNVIKSSVGQSLMHGDFKMSLYIVPMLKQFYPKVDELKLRVMATQIILPIQLAFMHPEPFYIFSGMNIKNQVERHQYIDTLIEQMIKN